MITAQDSTNDPAGPVLERARAIVEDLDFQVVADWKEDHPDGKVVGYLPVYVPRPLIEALGSLPVSIFGGGEQVEIIRGDSYFQSYICHIPRSTVEMALRGNLDFLDAMVFPSTCDVIRNLGGVFKLQNPERPALYLDLPQNFDSGLGGRFFTEELRRIADELEGIGAGPLTDESMARALEEENERQEALTELNDLRRREPWRVWASEAYQIVRAGGSLPATEHAEMIRDFLVRVREREPRVYDNVRVVLQGAFCEQPSLPLISALERAGCYIVEDDFQLGLQTLEGPVEIEDDESPLEALSRTFLERGAASAIRYVDKDRKGDALVEKVRRADADGVIFSSASFCDPALLDRPMMEAALDREGIPHTSFKFSENTAQFGVIREQAGAFSDSVKLWGATA